MFRFFKDPEYRIWSVWGTLGILATLVFSVYLDLKINRWFGEFYDLIQVFLSYGNVHDESGMTVYLSSLAVFFGIAMVWIITDVLATYLTQHWLFRWRASMVGWYHKVYKKARKIEGASQRVQEDTIKFTRIIEGLGTHFVKSVLTFALFYSELLALSWFIPVMFFGDWDYGLVAGAAIWTIGGMAVMAGPSKLLRLVNIEYDIQKEEAAYRKALVIAEDDGEVRPKTLNELFESVRTIHYKNYLRYLWFNIGRMTYYQANVLTAYIFLAPAIVGGFITLGLMQQIVRAFGKVESSMQYFIHVWPTIIELGSVYKRLREFESKIKEME